jgi:glycosyltransferase involved in cell wall biosynthesis
MAAAPRRALVLVRNTVTHDARVLREADTLRRLGFAVLIAGVVSGAESERRATLEGVHVVRLTPITRSRPSSKRPDADPAAGAPAVAPEPRAARPASIGRALPARIRRLAITIIYYIQGIRLLQRARPALVHANDYNTMWIGVAAKLLWGSRLVYDSHELWPDRNGRPEWRPWLLACEALFVRVADATITTSPGYAAAVAKRYRVPPPLVIRNIPARPAAPRDRDRAGRVGGPLGVYVGGLMPGRGLEPAIRALAHAPEFRLKLVGPGNAGYRARLRRTAEQAGVSDRLELAPAVAPDAVVDAIADADLGLMLIEPICRSYELTLPNKLFEYVAANLPILSSDLPVIGPLVESEQLGAVVPAGDPEAIARAMLHLVQPDHNSWLRERVASFAQRTTWEQEQGLLAHVYKRLLP